MQNIVGLVSLIAIAVLLAWSSFRTWRVKNRIGKWGGAGLLALLSACGLVRQRAHVPGDDQAAQPLGARAGHQDCGNALNSLLVARISPTVCVAPAIHTPARSPAATISP